HYMMGGIPTNVHAQVVTQDAKGNDQIVEGLYAAGECACVSVHGANRLGGNSLLDLIVFGRAAGMHVIESLKQGLPKKEASQEDIEAALQRYNRWNTNQRGESVAVIRAELQKTMQHDFGVFRTGEVMQAGLVKLKELQQRLQSATLTDK